MSNTTAAQIAGETPAAEGHVQAPALPPAWSATASLAGGGVLLQLVPSAPRPFSPALADLLAEAEELVRRPLRLLRGIDPAQALAYVVAEIVEPLRQRHGHRRVEALRRLAARVGEHLDQVEDLLRLERWLQATNAAELLVAGLQDMGIGPAPPRWNERVSEDDEHDDDQPLAPRAEAG